MSPSASRCDRARQLEAKDTRQIRKSTIGHLEADFADGSVYAGVQLVRLYLFEGHSTPPEKDRAVCILNCILGHTREARRLMAYCYLYGVGVSRDLQVSKGLLREL